jgi:hypothetical protein
MRRPTGIMRFKMYGKLQECFYCFMIPLNVTPMLLIHSCCYTVLTNPLGDASDYYKRLYKRQFEADIGVIVFLKKILSSMYFNLYFWRLFQKGHANGLDILFFYRILLNTGGCLIKMIAWAGVTIFSTSFSPFWLFMLINICFKILVFNLSTPTVANEGLFPEIRVNRALQ